MIFEIFVSIASICAIYTVVTLYIGRRPKKFPPGPFTWPIVGNLLQLGMEPYKGVMKMRVKYGDIVAIDMGAKRTVFVNEYKLLREIFNFSVANGRPLFCHMAEQKTGIPRGIVFTSGQIWHDQRRLAFSYIQSALREENNKEKLVMFEVDETIKEISNSCGAPMNTRSLFNIPIINSLWIIIAGKRYSLRDKAFKEMIKHVNAIAENPIGQGFIVFFPTFSQMFPKVSGYTAFQKELLPVLEFMKTIVKEHNETYQEGILRDFVDLYLKKIKSTTDIKSAFYGETGERNLEHSLLHLFMAGTETVTITIHWCIFLMAHFTTQQEKLISIIRKFKSQTTYPISLQDRERLPYIDAMIQEVLRFSSIMPLGAFHEALEDFEFHGYRIPQGTAIVANQYGIMHDPEVWGDPENFKPERFLSENEMEVINHPALVPFGVGRRNCPGESFARDELFFFLTHLFQNFRVEFDPSIPIPPIKHVVGASLSPPRHNIVFHKLLE